MNIGEKIKARRHELGLTLRQLLGQSFDQIYADLSPEERRAFWRGILESVTIRTGEITDIVFKA